MDRYYNLGNKIDIEKKYYFLFQGHCRRIVVVGKKTMVPLEQLKQLVRDNLQKDGFLNNMRAKLKLETFKIINQESNGLKENAGFQWEHPQLNSLKKMEYGQVCLDMIYEFLEFFKLDYTLDVYKKEVNAKSKVQRKYIEDQINFRKTPDSSKPIFLNILTDYIHILENGLIALGSPKNALDYSNANLNNFSSSYGNDMYIPKEKEKENIEESRNSYDQSDDRIETKKGNWVPEEKEDMLDRIEREENERKQKELEEKERIRKEQERIKKEQEEQELVAKGKKIKKPLAPPVVEEKKPPPTAVNKIRGGSSKNMGAISSIYNIGGFGSSTQTQQKDPFSQTGGQYGFDLNSGNDPYGFDLDAPLKPAKDPYAYDMDESDQKDPYAFDITDAGFGGYGKSSNNNKKTNQYSYGFDDDEKDTKKKKDDPKKNKFAGSSGLGDPQSYDLDDGYVGVSYKSKNQKNKLQNDDSNEYLDEDIDDYQDSHRDTYNHKNNKKENRNPMFTSSEDIIGASQSYGFDQSVQSDVMENFDHFEPIQKKKR